MGLVAGQVFWICSFLHSPSSACGSDKIYIALPFTRRKCVKETINLFLAHIKYQHCSFYWTRT